MASEKIVDSGSVPPASAGAPGKDRPDHQEAIPLEDYLARSVRLGETHRIKKTETLPLAAALGRYLAKSVVSAVPVPPFTNSAMDGYAIKLEGTPQLPARFTVIGEQPAGPLEDHIVGAGEAVRIMTGAPLPEDRKSVV